MIINDKIKNIVNDAICPFCNSKMVFSANAAANGLVCKNNEIKHPLILIRSNSILISYIFYKKLDLDIVINFKLNKTYFTFYKLDTGGIPEEFNLDYAIENISIKYLHSIIDMISTFQ